MGKLDLFSNTKRLFLTFKIMTGAGFLSNLTVQEWFLIGIVAYVFLVILIVFLRYCALKRIFCPVSRCGLHCIYLCRCCDCDICPKCGTGKLSGNAFCCQREHSVYDRTCLFPPIPSCNVKCFVPNCKYIYCVCCECVINTPKTLRLKNPETNRSKVDFSRSICIEEYPKTFGLKNNESNPAKVDVLS